MKDNEINTEKINLPENVKTFKSNKLLNESNIKLAYVENEDHLEYLKSTLELICADLQIPKKIIMLPYDSKKQPPWEYMRYNITNDIENNKLIFEKTFYLRWINKMNFPRKKKKELKKLIKHENIHSNR